MSTVTRVSRSSDMLDTLERLEAGEDKWWGAWDTSQSW